MGRNYLVIDVIVLLFVFWRCLLGGCICIWGSICFRERIEVELNVRSLLSLKWIYSILLDLVLAHCSIIKLWLEDRTSSHRFLNLLTGFNGEKGRLSSSILDPFPVFAS